MKKIIMYAYLGAIAFVCTAVFTGCSSEDALTDGDATNANGKTSEVAVDFVMNIATSNSSSTRMTSANTQATTSETFRGIDNAVLMSFVQKNGSTMLDGKNIATAVTASKVYTIGSIMGSGAINPNGDGTSVPQSRHVVELSLPTETNTIAFWGKAIKTGTSSQQGNVEVTMSNALSDIKFTLGKRIPDDDANGFKQYEALIAAILTKIVNSRYAYEVTFGGTTYTGTLGWKDYVTIDTHNSLAVITSTPTETGSSASVPTTYEEELSKAYVTMNTIYPNEVRAGAGPAVAKTLSDLYNILQPISTSTASSKADAIAINIAEKVVTNLNSIIDPSAKQWRTDLSALKSFSGLASSATNLVTGNLNSFPMNFNVPQGAATLKFTIGAADSDGNRDYTYGYNETIPTYAMDGGTNGSFDPLNYRYPAELCYFGNSPIRVTDDAHQTSDYPDGVTAWDSDASWAANATGAGSQAWTANGHVLSTTRSVAMQQNINYGTALLQTTVRYGANELQDNNHNIQYARTGANENNNKITPGAGTFTLTGLLIGGVEETVGWNYLPIGTEPQFKSFIYDSEIPNTAIPAYTSDGAKSTPCYTLLWDNWNPANKGSKQNVVFIALELVNNSGKDFWGMNNLIRNGATFYISGKLDPDESLSTEDRSEGITWPTKYALPPYYEADEDGHQVGETIKEHRIFMQDYVTKADFVIGSTSLQSALVAVPDLRSTQISLGLSVDLKWETGLNFSEIVLGSN